MIPVEDTDISLEDIEREFGNEIARIVDGLQRSANVIDVKHLNKQRILKDTD
jgi:(p)ppGpp synthase/HD superfamily hydrolase